MAERPRSFVSAQMVAERAGVSRSAVSRTFTDGASVSEATRRKVMSAAGELGYHVNHLARGLIRDQSNIVCLVVSDITTPLRARMVDVLTRKLQAIEKIAMVINTGGDDESVSAALRQALNYRADATVVLSGTPSASLVETCLANGQRVVLINRDDHLEGSENLAVGNETAAREAFFLLKRAGCSRLAAISSEAGTPSLVERERGVRRGRSGRRDGGDGRARRPHDLRLGRRGGAAALCELARAGRRLLRHRSASRSASWMRRGRSSA